MTGIIYEDQPLKAVGPEIYDAATREVGRDWPSMAHTMLVGMLLMALAFWMYSIAIALTRVRAIILERESAHAWTRDLREVAA